RAHDAGQTRRPRPQHRLLAGPHGHEPGAPGERGVHALGPPVPARHAEPAGRLRLRPAPAPSGAMSALVLAALLAGAAPAGASPPAAAPLPAGAVVASVRVEAEPDEVARLARYTAEIAPGVPLDAERVRHVVELFYATGEYADVVVETTSG